MFVLQKFPAESEPRAEQLEKTIADARRADFAGFTAAKHRDRAGRVGLHPIEDAVLFADAHEVWRRQRRVGAAVRIHHPEAIQPFRLGVNGSGSNSTAWTTLKIALLAPIPSARVKTAASVKPGCLEIVRAA